MNKYIVKIVALALTIGSLGTLQANSDNELKRTEFKPSQIFDWPAFERATTKSEPSAMKKDTSTVPQAQPTQITQPSPIVTPAVKNTEEQNTQTISFKKSYMIPAGIALLGVGFMAGKNITKMKAMAGHIFYHPTMGKVLDKIQGPLDMLTSYSIVSIYLGAAYMAKELLEAAMKKSSKA